MTESDGEDGDDVEDSKITDATVEVVEDGDSSQQDGSDEDSDDDEDADLDDVLALAEQQEIGESDEDDEGSSDNDGDGTYDSEDDDEDDEDADSDDEEDRIFDRNFSWAAEDEAFINKLEQFAQANHHVLTGSDRKARNRLFKAIENGDFGDDLDDDELMGLSPAKKSKAKKFKGDDIWAEELQKQWEKDRATKADNKRKRAEERKLAAQTPYLNTHKKGTKKMAKKAARAARRAARTEDDPAGWDEEYSGGAGLMDRKAGNLVELDAQIHRFLDDAGHTTLSLPPMDKRARAQVHMLASAYSLVSKSRGAGRSRFTTLIKNSRSGVNVDTRKVRSILSGRGEASFGGNSLKKGKSAKGGKSAGGGGGLGKMGGSAPSNIDGSAVGWGADRIGADNVGHRLLTMMGWAEGSGVGASGGMADPIGATIKTSKGGLGF